MTKTNTFYLLLLLVVFSACSKEKRVNSLFTKGDGVWETQSYSYQWMYQGELKEAYTYENAGEMNFSEMGTMYWIYPDSDGDLWTTGGTWTNSGDELVLMLENNAYLYKITERKGKTMTLVLENKEDESVHTFTIKIKRK